MKNELCEHKFRLVDGSTKLGAHCPDCFPYRVHEHEFATFDEVVQWAWNTYKIDLNYMDAMDEDLKQQACQELADILEKEEEL